MYLSLLWGLRFFSIQIHSAALAEKVYDVPGTPPQHIVGVSKSNKKLTFVLKETHQYTESFKLKRQK